MKANDLNDLITQADAARIRDVSREAIADLITRGRLSTIEVAGQKFVKRSEIENFITRKAGRPPKAKPDAAPATTTNGTTTKAAKKTSKKSGSKIER